MQETIFCKTCGLTSENYIRVADEIRKWLPFASVYVQSKPFKVVVCRSVIATVINEGDVFSFVQRYSNGEKRNDVINHSEKRDAVYVAVERNQFLIEVYVATTVGDTENMKFRLTCLTNPEISRDFDDYASLSNELNNYMWDEVSKRLTIL